MPTTSQTGALGRDGRSVTVAWQPEDRAVQTNRRHRPEPGAPVRFTATRVLPARFPATTAAATATAAAAAVAAATATATAATTTEAATAATEPAAGRLGPCFVDREGAAAELCLVQLIDRALGVVVARHFDEREPAGPASRHVPHDADGIDRADLPEHLFEFGFPRFVREITHKQPTTHGADFPGARLVHPAAPTGEGAQENSPEWPFHSARRRRGGRTLQRR